MFIKREKELKKLNTLYYTQKFQLAIIYGKKQVGKTSLIKEFCKDKNAIYLTGKSADPDVQLKHFCHEIERRCNNSILNNQNLKCSLSINTWEDIFNCLYQLSQKAPIIFVIDEYHYLAETGKNFFIQLNSFIKEKFLHRKIFLILCSSSIGYVKDKLLNAEDYIYQRYNALLQLHPFTYFETISLFPEFTPEEQALLYGITNGMPGYLSLINSNLSIKDNIINLYLKENGFLYQEVLHLMDAAFREPSTYNSIIEAIAFGAYKLNEISHQTNMGSNKCAKYLRSLLALEVVQKETPITEENGKKSVYFINDFVFLFWYRFVFPNITSIIYEDAYTLYEQSIEPQLEGYMSHIFETICKDYLFEDNVFLRAPFSYAKIGRWWGSYSNKKKQGEIPIMAIHKENVLLGICNWDEQLTGISTLQNLVMLGSLFSYPNQWFYLFSKKGFTKELIQFASNIHNIILIPFDEIHFV